MGRISFDLKIYQYISFSVQAMETVVALNSQPVENAYSFTVQLIVCCSLF